MNKAYQKVGWKNEPSVETPINDENLGIMDNGIDVLDDRIVELDKTKANQADYLQLQTEVSNQSKAISSAQEQISSLNGKTDQTNEMVNVLGQKTDLLTLDVENLKTKTDETNSDVEELKGKTDSAAEDIATLKEKADETSEKLTEHEKLLNQHEEAIDNRIKKFYTSNLGETHISDSDDGAFRNIVIGGKSEQKTTTGDQASPSPDYPQEIKSADGMYTGKNKLPNIATTTTISGVTFTVNEDGSITANGRATANIRFNISEEGFELPQGNYLLSGTDIYHTLSACTISDNINDGTGAINIVTSGGSDASIKVTNDNTKHNVYIGVSSGKIVSNETIYPMIRPANTDSEYEPYTSGVPAPAPNKLVTKVNGKNLLPFTPTTTTQNGITFVVNDNGSVAINGEATGTASLVFTRNLVFPDMSEEYLISFGTSLSGVSTYFIQPDWQGVATSKMIPNEHPTFTMAVLTVNAGTKLDNVTIYPMVRRSAETYAPWMPYVPEQLAPIPFTLRSVGEGENEVRDLLYVYADGTGKLVQKIGVQRLTSDLPCVKSSSTSIDRYLCTVDDKPTPNNYIGLCTHFLVKSNVNDRLNYFRFDINAGNTRIAIDYAEYGTTDIESFKDFLDSNNVVCQWILATPIETILTAEQVKALFELRTHYGGTHISFQTENGVEPSINFDYACSLENFVEYVKEQMGDDRKFIYDMEDRLTQGNKALEQYLDAMLGLEG